MADLKDRIYWRAFKQTWKEFCQISSIHGLKYITDPTGNRWSRLIWALITFFSFIGANVLAYTFYIDFRSNPTRLNIETDHAPLSELMFPAITLCSPNFVNSIRSKSLIKQLKLPANMFEETAINYFHQSTGFRLKTAYNVSELEIIQKIVDSNNYSIVQILELLRVDCKKLLFRCRFQLQIVDCFTIFQVARTYSGTCCSFNIDQKGIDFVRKRASIHGFNGGISIIAAPIFDDAAITATYSDGVKLLVHKNNVFASETTIEKLIPVQSEVLVRIRPTVITCSNQIRQLGIADRNCLFPEERKLRFFADYDDENCVVECQILSIVDHCHCIPYYFIDQNDFPVCNYTRIPCLVDNLNRTEIAKCTCPSNCQTTIFDVQTNTIPFSLSNLTYSEFYKNIESNSTIIHIYLISQVYRKLRRDLLTNFISLIAYFGNAYSLFIGMSILSVVEVVYFFTNVFRKSVNNIEEEDRKLALYTKRLQKIVLRKWKSERKVNLENSPAS